MLKKSIIISVLIILGFFVRTYKIGNPVADWHSHRQADTASVNNYFLENKTDFLHPKYHDFSNVQSGKENPNGYRMVELPVYNVASVYFNNVSKFINKNIPTETNYRLTSIFISLLSAIFLYLFVYKYSQNFVLSCLSMSIFLFLPFNIYYSRSILPEPLAVFFLILTIYFFEEKIILSAIAFSLGLLIKPFIGFIIFPLLLLFSIEKLNKTKIIKLIIFALISLTPFILWRLWISGYPEGIPSSNWLMNNSDSTKFNEWYHGVNISFLNKMVAFKPYWFQWLFYERINKLILGSFGLIFAFLGLAITNKKIQKINFSLIIGVLLYFVIIAQGNIQHDYYQTLIIPVISVLVGSGVYFSMFNLFKSKTLSIFLTTILIVFTLYFSWNQVKEYYKINNQNIILAGQKADEILPKNSIVIAPYQGDTAFLYQTKRSGYPIEIYNVDEIKKLHKTLPMYLISTNYDDYTNMMVSKYSTVYKNDQFIILDLLNETKN